MEEDVWHRMFGELSLDTSFSWKHHNGEEELAEERGWARGLLGVNLRKESPLV